MKFNIEKNKLLKVRTRLIHTHSFLIEYTPAFKRLRYLLMGFSQEESEDLKLYSPEEVIKLPFDEIVIKGRFRQEEDYIKDTIYISYLLPYFADEIPFVNFKEEENYFAILYVSNSWHFVEIFDKAQYNHLRNSYPPTPGNFYMSLEIKNRTLIIYEIQIRKK